MSKVAICVGHSRDGDKGAKSINETSEWDYNQVVAEELAGILTRSKIEAQVFDYYAGNNYVDSMSWLAKEINAYGSSCAIELHFNSATSDADGYEYLYWHSSTSGKRLAECFHTAHQAMSFNQKSRGIKTKNDTSRGALFLRKPLCPCVICEPFFGSSEKEWAMLGNLEGQALLAAIYANGIADYLQAPLSLNYRRPQPGGDRLTGDQVLLSRLARLEYDVAKLKARSPNEF